METKRENKGRGGFKNFISFFYIPITIFYLEVVLKLTCYEEISFKNWIYTLLFSMCYGLLLGIIAGAFKRKANRTISLIFIGLITLLFCIQIVYFNIFKTFTSVDAVNMAGQAIASYWRETLSGIWRSLPVILLFFIPFVLFYLTSNRFLHKKGYGFGVCLVMLLLPVLLFVLTSLIIRFDSKGGISYKYIYYNSFSPLDSANDFGLLTMQRLDIENLISPKEDDIEDGPTDINIPGGDDPITPTVYGDNAIEIDFDSLIANESSDKIKGMHEYFSKLTPTKKNEYTGMFEGYNLIWLCAEGFSSWAVDETHTPTLYKLTHEGFVFNNFYNPIWYKSTTDGEYTTTQGLIPTSAYRSFAATAKNYMPYGFGNVFSALGYTCKAYHDHTFEYYGRDQSHPNLGYDFKALGNGLEIAKTWPESDVEMMEVTIPEYINEEHFHTYYMTVSGHLEYNFEGNAMARKHKDDVQDLPYSDHARAYIACNMEFDQAMAYLLDELEKAGKLDNTVICFSGDHYPYGLTQEEMEEINGEPFDATFEMYRTSLCLWNSKMGTIQVDKYCSALDVMPTLMNLFGIEYDSRLITGQDILSDAPALVMFNNKSYITDYGRYDAKRDVFTPNPGISVPESYANDVLNIVKQKFKYSVAILENDYYAKVLK